MDDARTVVELGENGAYKSVSIFAGNIYSAFWLRSIEVGGGI